MRNIFFILVALLVLTEIIASPTPNPVDSHPYPLQPPSDPPAFTLSMKQQMEFDEKQTINRPRSSVTLPVF